MTNAAITMEEAPITIVLSSDVSGFISSSYGAISKDTQNLSFFFPYTSLMMMSEIDAWKIGWSLVFFMHHMGVRKVAQMSLGPHESNRNTFLPILMYILLIIQIIYIRELIPKQFLSYLPTCLGRWAS
jgi:hypothetical protein